MPANSRRDLIQRLTFKIVKNPGNGRLNNLNDLVLSVLNNQKNGLTSTGRIHIKLMHSRTRHILLHLEAECSIK